MSIQTDLHTITAPPPPAGEPGPSLAIRGNGVTMTEHCALCGDITYPRVPYATFTRDNKPVCDTCTARVEPQLAWMLWAFYSAGGGI